jgi:DNA invertase Pin-like site-specific DNA recombinase
MPVKGHRRWRGEKNYRAKLTADQVREIRAQLGTDTHAAIARRFNIGRTQISRIAKREIWGHVDG